MVFIIIFVLIKVRTRLVEPSVSCSLLGTIYSADDPDALNNIFGE